MAAMTWADFRAMIDDSPVDSRVVEWRRADGSLIAASLTDRSASGLSGVYKFFDPAESRRSLGSLVILWHIRRAAELRLPYVYLGYWIAGGSPKMAYKARFQPLERLTAWAGSRCRRAPAGLQPNRPAPWGHDAGGRRTSRMTTTVALSPLPAASWSGPARTDGAIPKSVPARSRFAPCPASF